MKPSVIFKKLHDYLTDKDYRVIFNSHRGFYNKMDDRKYLELIYHALMHKELNLDNPQTFNEKLQWLKLYDRRPEYTTMVDKYAVKEYVANIIGEQYIIPSLGIWNHFDEIDFDKLPNQFVLKCTHDSGGLVICKDKNKFDKATARKKIEDCLKHNYFYYYREWPYKNVKPRILAEKYMEDSTSAELRDYKFFCFGGVVKCFKVDFDRFVAHRTNYFSEQGELMKMGEKSFPPDFKKKIQITSQNLEKMKDLAAKLSETHPFLRADFYDVDGNIYFGEITFYPSGGFGEFLYEGNDELVGSWIELPGSIQGRVSQRVLIYKDLLCILTQKKSELSDYKIYTFQGKAKLCMINKDRGTHTTADYFDKDFNWQDFTWGHDHAKLLPEKPKNYELMFKLAEKLATGIPELRVDFYEVDKKIYFGELTFFDGSGIEKFEPEEWDYKLGSWIELPKR